MLFSNISKGKKEQAVFDEMSQAVHQLEENTTTEDDSNPLAEHYLALKEQNDDFIGWIKIDILLLDTSPKALYPNIVFATTFPIHTYPYSLFL